METKLKPVPSSVGPVEPSGATAPLPRGFMLGLVAVAALFALPLVHLYRFAEDHELFSYILLIPLVSGYWVWMDRKALRPGPASLSRWSGLAFGVAVILTAIYWLAGAGAFSLAPQDRLAAGALGFVAALGGVCLHFLSAATLRLLTFPLLFLLFLAPLPTPVHQAIESASQYASAIAAAWIFRLIDTPVFLQGTLMQLPGFSMEVAPECSGIRSTLVLLITAIVAGQMFLRRRAHRLLLVLLVAPVAIIRNGIRIAVIGELCVNIGPHMIDSFIHRRGGPIFFAMSLVPMFIAMWLLMRRERKSQTILPQKST